MPPTRTWTTHTFRCLACGRLARASQEALDDARWDADYGPTALDATIAAGFDYCLGCLNGDVDDAESEIVAECVGSLDADDAPNCKGRQPTRYAFTTPSGETGEAIWCEDCHAGAIAMGFAVATIGRPDVPDSAPVPLPKPTVHCPTCGGTEFTEDNTATVTYPVRAWRIENGVPIPDEYTLPTVEDESAHVIDDSPYQCQGCKRFFGIDELIVRELGVKAVQS